MHPSIRNLVRAERHQGWGTLSQYDFDYRHSDGSWQSQRREVYDHGDAATILLFDPVAVTVALVRQFRLPVELEGENPFILEACAGMLDGDDPEICARREALEETGITPTVLTHAFDLYGSPGSLKERTHCFIGTYESAAPRAKGGGVEHEGEDIEVIEMPLREAMDLIAKGGIRDAKTVALIQHAMLSQR